MTDEVAAALGRLNNEAEPGVDQFFADVVTVHGAGELRIKHAPFGYLQLLEDPDPEKIGHLEIKAGDIYIKSSARVDGEPILFYANGPHCMVWTYQKNVGDCRCRVVSPIFPKLSDPT